jgi:hypothetical protein
VRRLPLVLLSSSLALAACSLFLDSSEFAGGGDVDGGLDGSVADVASDTAPDAPGGGDSGAEAGDDFCTRSFADAAALYDPFDLPPASRWSRVSCQSHARVVKLDSDGQQPPAASFSTDAGVPAGTFEICWLEEDLPIGRVYRYGFDVKLVTDSTNGGIVVSRLDLVGAGDAAVKEYSQFISHGLAPTGLAHRYALADGGVVSQEETNLAQPTLGWVSYRVELTLGTPSRYRACRDGVVISDKLLDQPVDPSPAGAALEIGMIYTSLAQPPFELRFDNAFAEVIP